jgi:hypothetical protein
MGIKQKITGITALVLSLSACSRSNLHKADSLTVNTDDSTHYFVLDTQRHGEDRLASLAQEASVEEEWLYLEKVDRSNSVAESGIWLEIGENQRPGSVEGSKKVREYLKVLGKNEKENKKESSKIKVTAYHIHPLRSLADKYCTDNSWRGNVSIPDVLVRVGNNPSLTDYVGDCAMYNIVSRTNDEIGSEVFVMAPSRVVGPTGMYSYAVNNRTYCENTPELSRWININANSDDHSYLPLTYRRPPQSATSTRFERGFALVEDKKVSRCDFKK